MFHYTCPRMEQSLAGLTGGPANIAQVSLPTPPGCGLPGAFTCHTHESCVQGWSPPTQLWSRRSPWPRPGPLRSDRVGARHFSQQRSRVRGQGWCGEAYRVSGSWGKVHRTSRLPSRPCSSAGRAGPPGGEAGLTPCRLFIPGPSEGTCRGEAAFAVSRAPRATFVWLQGRTSGGPTGRRDSRGRWGAGLALAALAVRPPSTGRFLMEWFEMKTCVVHQMPSSARGLGRGGGTGRRRCRRRCWALGVRSGQSLRGRNATLGSPPPT